MKKLLALGDAGCKTGFARVVKGIMDRLHATGEWDISVRGVNYRPNHGIDYAYDVQAVSYGGGDLLGAGALPYFVDELKPDVIWALHDPWNLAAYALEKPPELPSVAYVPMDTPFIKFDYAMSLGAWSGVAAYTQFGARELAASTQEAINILVENTGAVMPRDGRTRTLTVPVGAGRRPLTFRLNRLSRLQNLQNWNIIPHGFDPGTFEPRDKSQCRAQFNVPDDAFVVGLVGGNHQRKRLDLAIRAFAEFAEDVPEAVLVMHCYGGDSGGYDLASLCRLYGIIDKVSAIHWQVPELSDDDLCSLYNTFDVMLNTSGGEGFNLPALEAGACGVPQVVPDWAATREIWQHHGLLIDIEGWRHAVDYLNTAHCNVSPASAANSLNLLYHNPQVREKYSALAIERAGMLPTWDQVGDAFNSIIKRAIDEPECPWSLQDALDDRETTILTEVAPQHAAV